MTDAFLKGWILGSADGGLLGGVATILLASYYQWNNWQICVWVGVVASVIGGAIGFIYRTWIDAP